MDPTRRDAPSHESHRPSWDPRQPYQPQGQPIHHFQSQPQPDNRPELPPSNFWDEEGSDSDVSRTFDIREPVNRIISPVALPRHLPQVSSPRSLNSLDEVQARLNELERTEDHNAHKLRILEEKRTRKDVRIARRRAMEDEKIKQVLDARNVKDERIRRRRQREDDAFRGADKQLGVEELDLRRRLRSLKRGLPIEEPQGTNAASMSPPMPQYQNGPRPPKRHQSGPPGQNESPVAPQARPTHPSPAASQYHFYQPPPGTPLYPAPYHHQHQGSHGQYHGPSPTLHSTGPVGSAGSPRLGSTPVDGLGHRVNGFSTPSPGGYQHAPPPSGPMDTRPPPPTIAPPHPPAPVPINAAVNAAPYDTRPPPPPPSTTGFTSVNAGQNQPSGFATVNSRGSGYATTPPKPAKEHSTPKNGESRRGSGKSPKTTTPITVGGLPLNKRTPSTTHPYQMSEAFANRHHHCERTDELNRGIWTSFGYMGSRDVPTGPPIEMYLRCNHDDCKRIDWRTVHGLQCHIVKNHDQPKGTIGSLEKALAIYGVPVSEIADYEKVNGLGSAGQMADPKNQKIKNKTKEAMQKSESPASGGLSTPTLTPSAAHTSNPLGGPLYPLTPSKGPDALPEPNPEASARPNNSFVAVRNTWSSYEPPLTTSAKDRGSFGKYNAPTPTLLPSSSTPVQPYPAPRELQERIVPPAGGYSNMDIAGAATAELSRSTANDEHTTPAVPAATTQVASVKLTAVSPRPDASSSVTLPAPSEPSLKGELSIPDESVIAAPPQEQQAEQSDKPVADAEPKQETKTSDTEIGSPTQPTDPPAQPPATPGRRPSRRDSVSLSKSAQKDAEASSMQSPRISKADNKRGVRRTSVAVSGASVSANASVDGDRDGEKSGDDAAAEKSAEKESGKTAAAAAVKRNAGGRFLRKGR